MLHLNVIDSRTKTSLLVSMHLLLAGILSPLTIQAAESRESLDLSGEWRCALDPFDEGEGAGWFTALPTDEVHKAILPGSLDTNKIGPLSEERSLDHLGKVRAYEGAAWYEKTVVIPESFKNRYVELLLERSKVTKIWINGELAGTSDIIYSQQIFNVSDLIKPGSENTIAICVNNDLSLVPVQGSHAYSEDTQSNWNGIIGKLQLNAMSPIHINRVRVYPDISQKLLKFEVSLSEPSKEKLYLKAKACLNSIETECVDSSEVLIPVDQSTNDISLLLGDQAQVWSDENPNFYAVQIMLGSKEEDGTWSTIDTTELITGLREFKATPDGFTINGHRTFLRGKHDGCVFPLTGYPPTTVEGWMREFGIAQTYGINHYRFHTFTPPEAAFEAADRLGIYIQPELPVWWGFDDQNQKQIAYLLKLGEHILDAYANHPSFVMFALGNEISKDRSVLKEMLAHLRKYDPRPLYAQGSNNRLWDPSFPEGDDYWRSFRTGPYQEDGSTTARLSMSYLDSNGEGGLLNSRYPSSTINFDKALERSPGPFLGFEVGQYQVFPNFSELTKYTGVLKPYNLEIYRDKLKEAGMYDQVTDFFLASGALSVLCYRADIEAMLRTKRYAGFDLLDLQDYPGQGTALVGILDAFMDSKGLIRPDQFREFCNDTVLLLEQEKYCWTSGETYSADISVSNFSPQDYEGHTITWQIREGRHVLKEGNVRVNSEAYSGLTRLEKAISISLSDFAAPVRLDIDLFLNGTSIKNSYPLWIYPESDTVTIPDSIVVAESLDQATLEQLSKGGNVLLFPKTEAIEEHSTANQFISEFWNWKMFTSFARQRNGPESAGTLGLLIDTHHEALADFPTEFYTDYQWWPIVTYSRALILDDLPRDYQPVVQVIDNLQRLHKLGLLCEFKVGEGKLLICTSRLPDHLQYPEVRQFYRSLIDYTVSESFSPDFEADVEQLQAMGL